MVIRNQRRLGKRSSDCIDQQARKPCKDTELIPAQVPVFSQRAGHRHDIEIQPVTEDEYQGHEGNREIVPFARTGHQYQYWSISFVTELNY